MIKQKNLSLTPAIREYIERKLIAPVKHFMRRWAEDELSILEIEIARTTLHHRKGLVFYAEVNASAGKRLIRAEAEDVDIHAAIDAVKDEFVHRLTAFKEKRVALERRGGRMIKQAILPGLNQRRKSRR